MHCSSDSVVETGSDIIDDRAFEQKCILADNGDVVAKRFERDIRDRLTVDLDNARGRLPKPLQQREYS